ITHVRTRLVYPSPPISILLPYSTLFRSHRQGQVLGRSPCVSSVHGPAPSRPRRGLAARRSLTRGHTSLPGSLPPQQAKAPSQTRSEEHTSELQSQSNLVCSLMLEKKNIY